MPAISYLVPADLPTFYDANRVLQLLSDNAAVPATLADLAASSSDPYKLAMQAIRSAANEIDKHCQEGKRYLRTDLENITNLAQASPSDETLQKRAAGLRQLTADLAYYNLMTRRGYTAERIRSLAPRADDAFKTLELLAAGVLVFDIDAKIAAGAPKVVKIGSQVYRPSLNNRMFGVWTDWPGAMNNVFGYWNY